MRIGVLTAGGDCPGLNAVIRSVVHRALTGHGDEVIGFEDGFVGLLEGRFRPLDLNSVSGILARGGTILGSARLERDRLREAADERRRAVRALRHRRPHPDRRRGHADRRPDAVRRRDAGGRRAQDHRQRHQRHRPHLRLRHRGRRRDRGDRPAQDHRGVPPAGDGRRGDGPARRLDRPGGRHGRRRARHLRARAPLRPRRPGEDGRGALRPRQEVRRHLRRRGRPPGRRTPWTTASARSTSSATSASHGIGTTLARELETPARQGGPPGHPRPRPARRRPHRLRPGAGHPLRLARRGGRPQGRLRPHDGPARHRHRRWSRWPTRSPTSRRSPRTGWRRPSRSSDPRPPGPGSRPPADRRARRAPGARGGSTRRGHRGHRRRAPLRRRCRGCGGSRSGAARPWTAAAASG